MNKPAQGIASLFLSLCSLSHSALAVDLNVVHSGNWPPYSGENLPEHGLAIDLVTTALKRAGHRSHLRIDSLNQILEGSKAGIYDVFATPWYIWSISASVMAACVPKAGSISHNLLPRNCSALRMTGPAKE